MSVLQSWALVFRGLGVVGLLLAGASLFVSSLGLLGLFAGMALLLGMFFFADVISGLDQIVSYFARQNKKAQR